MRRMLHIIAMLAAATTWAGELSPAMDQPGEFRVLNAEGKIQLVGRFELDLTALFRTYANAKGGRRRAPFTIGEYREGKIVNVDKGIAEYSISDDQIVFRFRPDVEDAGLYFFIHFDPSKEVSFGEAYEGNIAGPKPAGAAQVRFREKKPNQS